MPNSSIDTWLEEGLRYYSQGDPSRALEAWYRILDVDPGHSLAQQYVAYVRQVYRLGEGAPLRGQAGAGAESLPPSPPAEKAPIIAVDGTSWGDVVDSAFDVTPPKGGAPSPSGPPPASPAKMSPSNPWAPPAPRAGSSSSPASPPAPTNGHPPAAPPAAALVAALPPGSAPPMPPLAGFAASPSTSPGTPAAMASPSSSPSSSPSAPIVTSPWPAPGASAAVPSPDAPLLEPSPAPPLLEPLPAAPPSKSELARSAAPELENSTKMKVAAEGLKPGVERGGGFDPWRGDTIPPVVNPDPEAAANAASSFDLAPTPPPTEVPPHVKPQPQPELAVDIEVDFGPRAGVVGQPIPTPPPIMASPTSTSSPPAWKQAAVDEVGVGGGLRKAGGARVDVGDKPLTPSQAVPRGPVEERVAKPSRRFGETWDTPSAPSPPSPSPSSSPPPSAAPPRAATPLAAPAADDPFIEVELAALSPPAPASSSSTPPDKPMTAAALAMAAAEASFALSGHGESGSGGGVNVVVDPWDEMGGPGQTLDLDKAIPTPSPFDALVTTPSPAVALQGPQPEDQCAQLMKGAKELFELGDFSGSLDLVEKVLKIDAENDSARAYMKRNESTLIKMYESKLGDMRRTPRQLMPPDEVIWMNMHHKAGFILSQVDGMLSFEDLLEVSGMTRFDTMRILADLVQQGIIG